MEDVGKDAVSRLLRNESMMMRLSEKSSNENQLSLLQKTHRGPRASVDRSREIQVERRTENSPASPPRLARPHACFKFCTKANENNVTPKRYFENPEFDANPRVFPPSRHKQVTNQRSNPIHNELESAMGLSRARIWSMTLFATMTWEPCVAFGKLPISRLLHTVHPKHSSLQATEKSKHVSTSIDIKEDELELSTGVVAQVLSCIPKKASKQPPLVFIHGSFHAAWCWTERYFPYFVSRNYPVVALSLRGTGGTFAGEGVKKVKIQEHASDIGAFLNEQLPNLVGGQKRNNPVLISHSFGGLAVMKYLENNPEKASGLAGIITMCSVPPSGNGKMTMRFLRRSLVDSWKITTGFAMKKCEVQAEKPLNVTFY